MPKKNFWREQEKSLKEEISTDRQIADQSKTTSLVPTDLAQIWACRNGSHFVDILPYIVGKKHPEKKKGEVTYKYKYYYHRDVGVNNLKVLCRQLMGLGNCPICEYQMKLIEEDADEERISALNPKPRMLYNIVCYDRGEESKGVQIWDEAEFYSQEEIMAVAKKRNRSGGPSTTINFASPFKKHGRTIEFERKPPKGSKFPRYVGYKLSKRNYNISQELLDQCYTLDELIPIPSYKEVKKIIFAGRTEEEEIDESYEEEEEDNEETDYDDEEENEETEDPFTLLEDAEKIKDLKKIIRDFDLDVKKSNKFKILRSRVRKALEELPEENEEDLKKEDIESMSWDELVTLIDDKDLDDSIDPDDYEDDIELAEAIIEELDL